MADPVAITITPADAWQKVATGVQAGSISIKTSGPDAYFIDNRDTGGAAPSNLETARRFDPSGIEIINNSVAIDVYIYAKGAPGSVIVDV